MTILRDVTNAKHREVERLPLIELLMSGNISSSQYAVYLAELVAIYSKLETLGDQLGILANLPGIHRTAALKDDYTELGGVESYRIGQATEAYLMYLDGLAADPTKSHLVLAHIYVRHMGDLYGGKLMARVVPGSGKTYQFEDRPAIIKKFNEILTVELGDEANRAFDWFIEIFTELHSRVVNG